MLGVGGVLEIIQVPRRLKINLIDITTIKLKISLIAKDIIKDKSNRYDNYIKLEYISISSNIIHSKSKKLIS